MPYILDMTNCKFSKNSPWLKWPRLIPIEKSKYYSDWDVIESQLPDKTVREMRVYSAKRMNLPLTFGVGKPIGFDEFSMPKGAIIRKA